MNEPKIQLSLRSLFSNYDYKLYNSYVFLWESDFYAISKTGYCIEVEIKVSRSDFHADKKKVFKHTIMADNGIHKPNKFYYACPSGLIKKEEIGEKTGLIYIEKGWATIVKPAKFLHKEKHLESKYYLKTLLNKFYFKSINQGIELREKQMRMVY